MNNKYGSKLHILAHIADGEIHFQRVMLFSSKTLATGFEGLRLFTIPNIYKGVDFNALSEVIVGDSKATKMNNRDCKMDF